MTIKNLRTRAATLIAASAILLAGCTGDSDESGKQADGGKEDSESSKVVNDAGVDVTDLDDAVATQTVSLPGSDEEIELRIFPIEVRDQVQVLKIAVTPTSPISGSNGTKSLFSILGNSSFRPQLTDRENLKVYSVISQGPNDWSIDPVEAKAARSETIIAWAIYAAPEDDVEAFDVSVLDSWPTFTDVPVQR